MGLAGGFAWLQCPLSPVPGSRVSFGLQLEKASPKVQAKSRLFILLLIVTLSSFLLCTLELGSPESSKVAAL